jgi:hypothetical protein
LIGTFRQGFRRAASHRIKQSFGSLEAQQSGTMLSGYEQDQGMQDT